MHEENKRSMSKVLKISIFLLLLLAICGAMFQPVEVYAEDLESLARNTIASAKWKIQEASDALEKFWNNVTDDTRREANKDINLARDRLRDAEWRLQEEEYNMSLREACSSLFLGARSKYRIYLNMTNLRIEKANETIRNIPWYLGKPWYAIDVLENATRIYKDHEVPGYFEHELYAEDAFELHEMTQYVVFTRMEQAIRELFLDDHSAYNIAAKAENLAILYQNEQNKVFWQIIQMVAVCLALSFLVGLILGVYHGPRIRRRISKWRKKRKKPSPLIEHLSENEQRYCLIIVETSGVLVTALLTLGALVGAVMQQVKYVYMFIGYMFEYTFPFIFSALLGIVTLYTGAKRRRFPDLFDITIALFMSGWFSFVWLFGLAKEYESLRPGWYYILPLPGLLFRFVVSLLVASIIVYIMKKKRLQ